jgi:hypothetical protein
MAPRLSKEEGDEINNYIYNDPNIDLNELVDAYGVYYTIVLRHRNNLAERIRLGFDPRMLAGRATLIIPNI